MTRRLAGLETEYAIRFTPERGADSPNNLQVFAAVINAVGEHVRMVGKRPDGETLESSHNSRVFVENGGAFNYEALSLAPGGGLLEGATPECRSATELLLYQAAQDRLLEDALLDAAQSLTAKGYAGSIGLLKNCRDGFDNLYGAQENYEVPIATGGRLWLLRFALVLMTPVLCSWVIFTWLFLALLVAAIVASAIPLAVVVFVLALAGQLEKRMPRLTEWMASDDFGLNKTVTPFSRVMHKMDLWISQLSVIPMGWISNRLALVDLRKQTLAFFASRCVITGAGTVREDGTFHLSQKADGIRRTLRTSAAPAERGILEPTNLLKGPMGLMRLDVKSFLRVFRRRQRLQVGYSDSNMAQSAELLKIGTAWLVMDLHEAGLLDDAPRLADPVAATHALSADPTLRARVLLDDGTTMTALDLQRFYLDRSKQLVETSSVADLDTDRIIRLWEEALDRLPVDPGPLVGRIDWVTKRFLLERHHEPAAQKKVDLKYHELSDGYLRRLERAGAAPRLTTDEDVLWARKNAPADSPAFGRAQWIRQLGDETLRVSVDWESIRIGGRLTGKVIHLVDHRRS